MERDHPVLTAVSMLVVLGVMVWAELPPWQRQQVTARLRLTGWRVLARAARASGRRAMADELAGRRDAAQAGYEFTYRLSRARDAL